MSKVLTWDWLQANKITEQGGSRIKKEAMLPWNNSVSFPKTTPSFGFGESTIIITFVIKLEVPFEVGFSRAFLLECEVESPSHDTIRGNPESSKRMYLLTLKLYYQTRKKWHKGNWVKGIINQAERLVLINVCRVKKELEQRKLRFQYQL